MKIIAFEWRTGGALSNSMTLKKKIVVFAAVIGDNNYWRSNGESLHHGSRFVMALNSINFAHLKNTSQ